MLRPCLMAGKRIFLCEIDITQDMVNKKLCCHKEATRCFVSVQLQYKTSSAVFYYQLFQLQIYHCVQLNSFLFSSLQRTGPCCRPSQTNIGWCVADCAIYTAWSSSVTGFCHLIVLMSSNLRQPAVRPESRFLPIHHLNLTPLLQGFPSEYRHPVWYGKT